MPNPGVGVPGDVVTQAQAVLAQIAKLAEEWAYQATDYDEDTEQQIADGNTLLKLLHDAGVDAAPLNEPQGGYNPDWIEHLGHPSTWRRAKDGLEPVPGCAFCVEEKP